MKFIDLHCDTISELCLRRRAGKTAQLLENEGQVDLARLRAGGCLAQCFAVFTHLKREADPLAFARAACGVYEEELEKNRDQIRPARLVRDILQNEREGKMSGILTVEEGGIFQGRREILEEFWQRGVRMITLTWNFPNELGYPNRIDLERGVCLPETERGLTDRGREFVEWMEELGIAVDVSHLGDAGFWEVAQTARKPFAASHSNARALASHVRNLTDPMIREIGSRGGVIGVNYCAAFLDDGQQMCRDGGVSRVADIVRHIGYLRQTGGIDCIALGSDFDGISGHLEVDSPAKLNLLEAALERAGFTAGEREKIFYGNVLRFFRDVWGG